MQYNRLTSDTSLIDYLKSLERKIDGVATKGSGDIIVTDPNTGVETLLGTLPDGSVGLDQFVNDVTPPGAPSTPVVLSSLEGVTVTWDGLQADGAAQPRDYDRTTIEMQVDGGFWAIVGTIYNKTTFTVSKLQPNVEHTFRLKSYDKKNNESEPSAVAVASPASILDDTQVDDALQELKDKDVELGQTAEQAAQDAQQALQDLINLNEALQVRPTTFYGATEPVADPERPFVQGDWWVDTDDSNKIYVWNGSDFILSADPRLDSAIETLDSLTEAGGVLDSMQDDIDGKITTHYGPAPSVKDTGDLWLDATDATNQVLKRWNGTTWVVFDNPRVQDAYTKAGTAQDTADKKIQTFTGTSAPVDNPTNDLGTGDLWINSTTGSGRISRWTGTQWVEVVDNGVSAANKALSDLGIDTTWVNTIETQADQAITTFYGTTTPTGMSTGDLWLAGNVAADGTTNYQMKRWDGDSWEIFENPRIQTAYTAAGTAQSTADSKIKTYAQPSAPTGLTVLDDGDLWIDTDNGQVSRWTGTQWTLVVDNGVAAANAALANLGINQTWVDDIETQADRAIATFYGSTSPTGMQTGDLWLSGVAGTPMKRWDGDSWETFEDPNVQAAYTRAGDALTAADSKILTYAQTTQPTGQTSPSNDGDLWINTTAGSLYGQIKRFASNTWTLVNDNGVSAAATAAATAKAEAISTAATGDKVANKWLYSFVDGFVAGNAPEPSAFTGPGVLRSLVSEGTNLVTAVDETYRGSLRTMVRVDTTRTITFTATHDDAGSVYVDGVKVYGATVYTQNAPISFSLTAGWHMIEFTWAENVGGDGWYAITPTIGSQVNELAAPTLASSAVWDAATAVTTAAADATAKSDAARAAATAAQGYMLNPSFDEWTSTLPNNYSTFGAIAPVKDTVNKRIGNQGLKFTVPGTEDAGIDFTTPLAHMPNLQYVTVEVEFMLTSGTLAGAGVLIDWNGLASPNRAVVKLTDLVSTPILNKWYRVSAVVERRGGAGTWTATKGWLMANWPELGTKTAKTIVYDWINVRPSTAEEIIAFKAPADIAAKGKVIISATEPVAADRLVQNLWIDTTPIGNPAAAGNVPKRWNTTSGLWEAVTEKAIIDAAQAAANAQTAADEKIKTYAATTAPTGLGVNDTGDLWINTTAGDINGQIKRWDGDSWELVVDSGKNSANAVLTSLGINQTWVNDIETQSDRAITTFYGTGTPASPQEGDLWLTGVAGEAMKRYSGAGWNTFEDPNVQAAYTRAGDALTAADTKILTYAQTTAPVGLVSPANDGDLWINTAAGPNNGQISRWASNAWTLVTDNGIAAANTALANLGINQTWVDTIEAQGDRAIATFFGTTTPTNMDTGDLWLSGVAGTPMKRWDGDSWEVFEDPNVQAAYQKAADAQSSADAKILTYAQATAPTGLDALNNGDLWIDTDDGKIYRYTHPNWVQVVDNGQAAADAALIALGINQTWVDDIEQQADRAIATFFGTATPTGMQTGDLWVAGTAGTPMKRWDGDSWENFEDPNVMAAYSLADQAKTDANAKILTYAQTTAPTGLTANNDGDLWINTTAGPLYGQIKRYTHPTWVLVSDNGVLASQNTAAFSGNPSFDDWTAATPNGYTTFGTGPTKETAILTKGSATSARWNITDPTSQGGLQFAAGIVGGHLPNLEYYTVELDFYLVSGSLSGAGVILDWNGTSMTNNRATISLATEYPSVTVGKWYRMTKVMRRPTNITGTWSSMGGYVISNWTTFTNAVKDIIIDWFNIRPSTSEEIKSYLGPTAADVAAKGKIIIQSTAPVAADQLVQNLWIDTTPIGNPASPGNIPKRWDPTGTPQWRVVSDKGIADAAAAAVAAQGTANQAVTDAGLALAAANARNRIVHLNTTPPVPADGWKNGDTWFKHETVDVTSPVIEWYRWSTADNAWKLQEFSESFLPSVNIGTGTYGSLAGVRLQSGSIEVEKLAVTDFTNLWPNPLFKPNDQGSLFYYIGTAYAGAEVPPVGGTIRELSSRDHIASAGNIPAVAGDSFVIEADVKRTVGALDLKGGLWSYKADGTITTSSSPENFVVSESGATALANGWERRRWIVLPADLPSDTASVRVAFQIDQTSTGGSTTWLLSNVSMRKRGGGELVIDGSLTGRSIAAKSIKAEQLLIASDNNLITEPDFTAGGEAWGLTSGFTIDPTAARNGGPALKIVNDATAQGKYNLPERIRIEPGAHYRMSVWIKSNVAIPANGVLLIFKFFNSSGAESTITGGVSVATPANTWVEVEGVVEAPSDAIDISFGVFTSSSFSTGNVWVDYVSAVRMGDAKLIVDGSVTADKLETDLVLATKIIAGNPDGTRAEMASDGFRVFAKDDPTDPESPVSEVVRMGVASTNDYFAIVKADGTLAASMSQDGMVSATGLTVQNDIEWKGESWASMYDALPKGIVAWGSRSDNSPWWAAGSLYQPYLSLTFDAVAGRAYRVWSGPIQMAGDTTTAFPMANLHYATGSTITVSAPRISQLIYDYNGIAADRRNTLTFNRLVTPASTQPHSLLISYGAGLSNGGQGKIMGAGGSANAVILVVEDIGLAPAETGESPNGTADGATTNPPPPPAKVNYVKTYYPTGTQSYTGTGAQYEYNTGYLYSGLSPAGYGDLRSMAMFGSQIATDVGAGTITKVRVYAYYDHWYYNSGGTADITLYAGTSLPATLASVSGTTIASTSWPKPGGRWVTLSSATFASIKAGTARGIMFGGKGRGYLGYGFLHDVRLEVSYTK